MQRPSAELDHLVVAAETLEQGTAYIGAKLGVALAGGGSHIGVGTHNRVLKLGPDRYLEVIAVDPCGQKPGFPRWFDLDNPDFQALLKMRPRLIAWVARTDAIEAMVEMHHDRPMIVRPMQRGNLRWRFAFTVDGAVPADGLIPHLIQWEGRRHPTESMADSGCTLDGLDGVHQKPAGIRQVISSMGLDQTVTIRSASETRMTGLSARIRTPAGLVVLD